jgi:predicted RecB family nuclease
LNQGASPIVQAVLKVDYLVGVPDILERTDSSDDHHPQYIVGDIKYSETVRVSHALQVKYYSELLAELGYGRNTVAFIVDRFGRKIELDLSLYEDRYARALAQLERLRIAGEDEKPAMRLTSYCSECSWRHKCMPKMDQLKHVSLIPSLSSSEIEQLESAGVQSVTQLPPEIRRKYERQVTQIEKGQYILKERFHKGAIEFATAAIVVTPPTEEDDSISLDTWHRGFEQHYHLTSHQDPTTEPDLSDTLLLLYGRDYDRLRTFVYRNGISARLVDVFVLVNRYVHAPLQSLELEEVASFARAHWTAQNSPYPECRHDRLAQLVTVMRWIESLESGHG